MEDIAKSNKTPCSLQVLTALAGGDEKVEKLLMENGAKATLLQRLGKPQEVAAAVFYIATQVVFLFQGCRLCLSRYHQTRFVVQRTSVCFVVCREHERGTGVGWLFRDLVF